MHFIWPLALSFFILIKENATKMNMKTKHAIAH